VRCRLVSFLVQTTYPLKQRQSQVDRWKTEPAARMLKDRSRACVVCLGAMHMPWRRKMRAPESAKDTAWLLGARGDRYAPTQSERPLDQSALGLESLMPLSPLPAYPANVVAPTSRSFVSASVRNFSSDGRTTGKIIVCPKCDTEYHVCDLRIR